MRQQALIGALIVAGAGAQAAPVPQSEDDLRSAVAGKTVAIDTPLGLPLTVNYGANGIMTGTVGTALAVYLGSAKDRGRWHIKNGKLCQKWFKWLGGDMTCLSMRQEGLKIYWRSDEGKTGTAMIEPGPPVIEGATASGLGLPPQPVGVEKAPAAEQHAAIEPPSSKPSIDPADWAPASIHAPQRSASPPVRREPTHAAHPKPAIAVVTVRPTPILASFGRETEPQRDDLPTEAPTPPLVELPRAVVRPLLDQAEPSVARFAVAALVPMLPPAPQPEPVTAAPSVPFAAEREPMRQAVEAVSRGVLEHRWCLANGFAKEPAQPSHAVAAANEQELVSAPSLLAVAHEQAYEGELPLHEPACLTEAPAIGTMARLINFDR